MNEKDKKYLKYGGLLIGIGVALYFIFKKDDNASLAPTDPTGNGNTGNTGNSGNSGATVFNAKKVAETLYNAMREMGTDERRVINTLRYVSPIQFNEVFRAFGTRQYNKSLGNQYNLNPFSQLPFENLQVWLENELSVAEYDNLKRKYPNKL